MNTDRPPDARARVDEITRLVVEKLLLTPTEQLKALGDPDTVVAYSDALSRLFNLAGDDITTPADSEGELTASKPAATRPAERKHHA